MGLANTNFIHRMDQQQGPIVPYSTENYIQPPGINHDRKEHEKEYIKSVSVQDVRSTWTTYTRMQLALKNI